MPSQTEHVHRSLRRPIVISALLVLVAACSAPAPASSASTAPPSVAKATPSPTAPTSTVPTSSVTPIPLPSFVQLSAPSSNVVWALVAGTRLFRSTDRGDNWEERPVPMDPLGLNSEIAFITEGEGWLATPGQPGSQCTFQSVGIAHTVDGGATWDPVVIAAPLASTDPSGLAVRQCKDGLTFVDQQRGFLSASDPNSPPIIHRTSDGGRTWSASRPLPDPPGFTTRPAVGALRAGRVHAFGTTLLVDATGTIDGRLVSYSFRSVDGGASWSYQAARPESGGAFAFVSASRWLQIAPPGSQEKAPTVVRPGIRSAPTTRKRRGLRRRSCLRILSWATPPCGARSSGP